jgi:hypothetical protein
MVNTFTEIPAGKFKVELLKKPSTPVHDSEVPMGKMSSNFASLTKLNDHITEIVENSVYFAFVDLLKKISTDYQEKGITYEELHNRYVGYFKNDSNIFCDLLSSNVKHLDLVQLKQEIQTLGQKLPQSATSQAKGQTPETSPTHSGSPSPPPDETPVIDSTKCYARTGNSKQCSRKKQKVGDYCGGHAHNQPHGRIDQPLNEEALQLLYQSQGKKRGRPIKPNTGQKAGTDEAEATEHVVEMDAEIETIGGIDYIIDKATQNIYKSLDNMTNSGTVDANQLHLVGLKTGQDSVKWYTDQDVLYMKKYGK